MPRVLPYTCTYMHSLLYVPLSISFEVIKEKEKADSTLRSSRAVPHPSTNRALRRLTSEVRRDPVYSTRYGRQQQLSLSSRHEGAVRPYGEAIYLADMRGARKCLHFSTAHSKINSSSAAGPQRRCAERSSAGAQRKKGQTRPLLEAVGNPPHH